VARVLLQTVHGCRPDRGGTDQEVDFRHRLLQPSQGNRKAIRRRELLQEIEVPRNRRREDPVVALPGDAGQNLPVPRRVPFDQVDVTPRPTQRPIGDCRGIGVVHGVHDNCRESVGGPDFEHLFEGGAVVPVTSVCQLRPLGAARGSRGEDDDFRILFAQIRFVQAGRDFLASLQGVRVKKRDARQSRLQPFPQCGIEGRAHDDHRRVRLTILVEETVQGIVLPVDGDRNGPQHGPCQPEGQIVHIVGRETVQDPAALAPAGGCEHSRRLPRQGQERTARQTAP